ncbi:MAG: aminopeptidase P family protein [Candidatus Eisenbacteria bacterium]|uniref:Aminopeptidase P family protein n=1 Tax=Eiseniibacteriota bacterium TaxID=2212470 RepID=A0A538U068_UNCEI|nr:MAG: aminopeptidase P family protein [Candidatus Eisenbacteria bacterium]
MSSTSATRIARARRAIVAHGADVLLIAPAADFRWLTGATARSTERLLCLAIPREGAPFCLVPRLEADALAHECPGLELVTWEDHEDPLAMLDGRLRLDRAPTLLLGEGFRIAHVLALAARAPCRPAAPAIAPLRAVKEAEELRHLAEAGRHADAIVLETAEFMRPGMTELEVARFALQRFEGLGDTDPWAIVASGPNSALPHHFSSTRRLAEGDVVILDLGAFTAGYGSDITRTFWLGQPPAEAEKVYAVVDRARRAGIDAARAGVPCQDVDRAARAVIEDAGYGEFFIHRTGHGVGLEVHEPPYLMGGNRAPLEAGNVHSVEPGIYLPGRFGVRLEDLVAVEEGGANRLNRAPFDPLPQRVRG